MGSKRKLIGCFVLSSCLVGCFLIQACNFKQNKKQIPPNKQDSVAGAFLQNAPVCTPGTKAVDKQLGDSNNFNETIITSPKQPINAPVGMKYIAEGEFSMGSADADMADALPVHRVTVKAFYMDETPVTNKQFSAFVKATGYITVAERTPAPEDFPGVPVSDLVAGSLVFTPPKNKPTELDFVQWWSYIKGANWRHPEGGNSTIKNKDNYPVVQVCWEDATAYAKWAGKRLPTEAEWEYAARGGLSGKLYTWGDTLKPNGRWMANIFQGEFPIKNTVDDGFLHTSPVKQFKSNRFGLYDMAGNVWEWCADWYRNDYYSELANKGLAVNPQGPESSFDPDEPNMQKKVLRGGSFLCTDQYCTRYMVGSRGKGEFQSAANNIGFRCVKDI